MSSSSTQFVPLPKAVLFDLFHTLACVPPPALAGEAPVPQILGVPAAEWQRLYYDDDVFGRCIGRVVDGVDVMRMVTHSIDPTVPEERILAAVESRRRRFETGLVAIEGVILAALDRLRAAGIRTALVSDAGADDVESWQRSPLRERFDAIVFSYQLGVRKPDARIYHRVLDTIHRLGLDGNTLVVLTSDNGGERYSYHYPLTGYIRLLREGGIRVPGVVRWRGRIPAGQTSAQMAITMDWTATFLALAGASADARYPLDGENLLPVFSGERAPYDRTLYWRTPVASAVRRGPWKYLRQLDTDRAYLFNLIRDIREYSNFRDEHPDIFTELERTFAEWEETVLPRPGPPPRAAPVPGLEFQIF